MKIVIQRVQSASVTVNGELVSSISNGLLILAGMTHDEGFEDLEWLAGKVVSLRVFPDEQGVMNLSVKDTQGEILVVSQFTLYASTKKGNRPSYIDAAKPDEAKEWLELWLKMLETQLQKPVKYGIFGADMKVSLTNDGPVTIIIDSKNRV